MTLLLRRLEFGSTCREEFFLLLQKFFLRHAGLLKFRDFLFSILLLLFMIFQNIFYLCRKRIEAESLESRNYMLWCYGLFRFLLAYFIGFR